MLELFTARARKVLSYAKAEAGNKFSDSIGTEHILFGLVKEGSGVAHNILERCGVTVPVVREQINKTTVAMETINKLLVYTPRAKKILEYACEEAVSLGHNYVGTEHLLLGLLRETDGVAVAILKALTIEPEDLRRATLELLGHYEVRFKLIRESEIMFSIKDACGNTVAYYFPKEDEIELLGLMTTDNLKEILTLVKNDSNRIS